MAPGRIADDRHEILVAVGDGDIGTQGPAELQLLPGPGRAHHPGAIRPGQLNGDRADPARAAVHQEGLTGGEPAHLEHVGIHGAGGLGQRRRVHDADPVRDGQHLPGGDRDLFRVAAARHQRADVITWLPSGHLRPDGLDPAGAFHPRIGRSTRRRWVQPLALQQIRPVDARSGHVDQDFAGAHVRIRYFLPLQYLWPTRLGDNHGPHISLLCVISRYGLRRRVIDV